MSQWNNSYAYNQQYQGSNTWNGEINQYSNQQYYPNTQTQEPTNQYVNFQEFLSQMQSSNTGGASSTSFNNPQYQNYPTNQYEYQNMPSTSQNHAHNYYPTNSGAINGTEHQTASHSHNKAPEPSYNSQMVFKSNLTATATEFVPKGMSQQPSPPEDSSNHNGLSEAKSEHSANKNWREKQSSEPGSSRSYNEPRNEQEPKRRPEKDRRRRNNESRNSNVSNQKEANSQSSEFSSKNDSEGGDYDSNAHSYDSNKHTAEYTNRNFEASNKKYESNSRSNRKNEKNESSRNEGSSRKQESNSLNNESNNWNNDLDRNYDSQDRNYSNRNNDSDKQYESSRNYDGNSRNYDSKRRNYDSNGRNYDSNNRYYEGSSRNYDSNNRNYDSRGPDSSRSGDYNRRDFNGRDSDNSRNNDHSQDPAGRNNDYNGRNQDYNSRNDYNRSYDSNRGYENSRSQGKNSKSKSKDADNRTFYNSSVNKSSQDVRSARGDRGEGSGRNRNWAGTQRVRPLEKQDDEQFAKGYLDHRDERNTRKPESMFSPMRSRNRQMDNVGNTDMTQRERLTEQLDKGTLECLVCCERVKQIDSVWSCGNCYHVLHLRCIRKWAMSSIIEGKWRCPACQNTSSDLPSEYRCMCGAVRAPEYQRGAHGAHTCGQTCQRPRSCPHPCTLPCHPGPCPPCQATVNRQCGCGAETRSVLCSSKLAQVCGRVCSRQLECGVHTCVKECHEGPCDPCGDMVEQVCYCPGGGQSRSVPCTAGAARARGWSCGAACSRVLACGAHVCRAPCHAPPCAPCALLPAAVLACPCTRTRIPEGQRKSCTDPIPLCGNICAKPLPCGPPGDKHFCKLDCHEGPCPVCPDKTLVPCRCGHSSREVPCADLVQMQDNVLCQKKCNKKLSCGRHRCRASCCAATTHRCGVVCGRTLNCQLHRCEQFCHTGHCAPCTQASFEELTCECGAEVILPPVPCGTKRPACKATCRRARACGHDALHACHEGPCPPCVVLTTKHCHGRHEERKTIPCSQEEFSCGLPCGKPLPCGKHSCQKICHTGPCDAGKCTQPCNEKRPTCGHACAAPCHSGTATSTCPSTCPSTAPCRRLVRATCPCGRRAAERTCHENKRDRAKILSALAASKMQEGGSVDLSEVQHPAAMLRTLECDDECRVEARTRRLALALQIRNPDVSAKLAPRYSEHARALAAREPAFACHVHDKLTELVQLAKKSKQKTRAHSFPSCNWQKRQFIHEMCEQFGCESVAYDAEPNRNVVATADKEKSWLPAMSVLQVLARENGKRRVPGPVLRAPPAAAPAALAKSTGGWATLTSTNAWAARAQKSEQQGQQQQQTQQQQQQQQQQTQQPRDKIDYFDNPPDN